MIKISDRKSKIAYRDGDLDLYSRSQARYRESSDPPRRHGSSITHVRAHLTHTDPPIDRYSHQMWHKFPIRFY